MSEATSQTTEPFVRVTRNGRVGRITLTRPQAINALTHAMILAISAALRGWLDDEEIECITVDGDGVRGFCAGGDIKAVSISALSDGGASARALWWDEYRLNALLSEYPKPVVPLMHGITYGGGVGLGCHAGHRVITEDTRLAMPETIIGLVPDVGGTWLLSRAPGELGTHLALTGLPIGPADALRCGLADVHVPAGVLAELRAATSWKAVQDILATSSTAPAPAGAQGLGSNQEWIDRCYAHDDVASIIGALQSDPEPAAQACAGVLLQRSPTALQITLTALRRAAGFGSLRENLVQDYRIMAHSLDRADVREGIRAQVVDKDRNPRWNPADVAGIDPAVVALAFTEAPGGDLSFG